MVFANKEWKMSPLLILLILTLMNTLFFFVKLEKNFDLNFEIQTKQLTNILNIKHSNPSESCLKYTYVYTVYVLA